jgi:hypothetical protein
MADDAGPATDRERHETVVNDDGVLEGLVGSNAEDERYARRAYAP